jgi:hypothetical protein
MPDIHAKAGEVNFSAREGCMHESLPRLNLPSHAEPGEGTLQFCIVTLRPLNLGTVYNVRARRAAVLRRVRAQQKKPSPI